jgi:hypothetical protein
MFLSVALFRGLEKTQTRPLFYFENLEYCRRKRTDVSVSSLLPIDNLYLDSPVYPARIYRTSSRQPVIVRATIVVVIIIVIVPTTTVTTVARIIGKDRIRRKCELVTGLLPVFYDKGVPIMALPCGTFVTPRYQQGAIPTITISCSNKSTGGDAQFPVLYLNTRLG